METIIISLELVLIAMEIVIIRHLRALIKESKDQKKRRQIHVRKKRKQRHVIVKKTHEREIVRVTPTATEFMQNQYKRVAKQYNENK